ncbi:Protein phosphatase 2C-like protein [Colletotrichum trifolii]|uniref:Protein phosphatase 2C-like protein n=1 Tax=Colletotrichum trifolii TaxID=5466 RepID=A0A4R8RIW0_COLTR|nr:Protein phosphatase 2C-like protein [Colletotrichum trifolii]
MLQHAAHGPMAQSGALSALSVAVHGARLRTSPTWTIRATHRSYAVAGARVRASARTGSPRWTRASSTATETNTGTTKPKRSSTPQLIGLGLISGAVGYGLAYWRRDGTPGKEKIPRLASEPVDIASLVDSPVDGGSFQQADAKLREDVFVGSFYAENTNPHVHAARVASNHPVEDTMAFSLAPGVGKSETLFNGVFDGHAGWATSLLLKKALIPAVSSQITQLPPSTPDEAINSAIVKAFTSLDELIFSNAKKAVDGLEAGTYEPGDSRVVAAIAPAIAGSCALLSVFDPAALTIRVACTGDSRAVLGSLAKGAGSYSFLELSKDQTGFNQDECDRLAKEHPGEEGMIDPKTGRLFGIAVTRAFGDHRWKWTTDFIKHVHENFWGTTPRPKTVTPPYMTAAPVVTSTKVEAPDFVILASDGLWDHISSEHAVECVAQWIAAKKAGKQMPKDKLAANPGVRSKFDMEGGWPSWLATPADFVVEDLDNAAVHLIKNALGGNRRTLFTGATLAYAPLARSVRDDVTVQVIFFQDPARAN